MDAPRISLYVADDRALIRDAIRLGCESAPDVRFAGASPTAEDYLADIERVRPDAVLVRLALDRGTGIGFVREGRRRLPDARFLALAEEDEADGVMEAINEGAHGCVTTSIGVEALLDAVRRTMDGQTAIDGIPSDRLLQHLVRFAREAHRSAEHLAHLSPRERDVLTALARGESNQQIAGELGISARTVASHVTAIYQKLHVTNRVEATHMALRLGLLDPADVTNGDDG